MKINFSPKLPTVIITGLVLLTLLISPVLASNELPAAEGFFSNHNPLSVPTTITATSSIMFVENTGQFDPAARFQVQGANTSIWLAENALWISILEKPAGTASPDAGSLAAVPGSSPAPAGPPTKGVDLRLTYPGSNPNPTLEPFNRLSTHFSYFTGQDPAQWRKDVPVWGGVRYKNLYPNIDLEISSENGQVVQRLVTRTGADLSDVSLRVDGANSIQMLSPMAAAAGPNPGALLLDTAVGEYTLPLLQLSDNTGLTSPDTSLNGNQVIAPFASSLLTGSNVSLLSGAADMVYGTFLGGTGSDYYARIALIARMQPMSVVPPIPLIFRPRPEFLTVAWFLTKHLSPGSPQTVQVSATQRFWAVPVLIAQPELRWITQAQLTSLDKPRLRTSLTH